MVLSGCNVQSAYSIISSYGAGFSFTVGAGILIAAGLATEVYSGNSFEVIMIKRRWKKYRTVAVILVDCPGARHTPSFVFCNDMKAWIYLAFFVVADFAYIIGDGWRSILYRCWRFDHDW